jgi:transposase-like protein
LSGSHAANGAESWTIEQKQMIAAQSLARGASATEVARQHGIGTGQLYN